MSEEPEEEWLRSSACFYLGILAPIAILFLVTNSPWPRFFTQLDFPFHTVLIANVELGIGAVEILFEELKRATGLVLGASRPVNHVSGSNIDRILPQHRGCVRC